MYITKQGIGLGCCLFKLNLDIEISTLSYRGKAMYFLFSLLCTVVYIMECFILCFKCSFRQVLIDRYTQVNHKKNKYRYYISLYINFSHFYG